MADISAAVIIASAAVGAVVGGTLSSVGGYYAAVRQQRREALIELYRHALRETIGSPHDQWGAYSEALRVATLAGRGPYRRVSDLITRLQELDAEHEQLLQQDHYDTAREVQARRQEEVAEVERELGPKLKSGPFRPSRPWLRWAKLPADPHRARRGRR